ncbi:MAG: hypothetical protein ACMUIE_06020, partial [Thermoplasmatota archaeon]
CVATNSAFEVRDPLGRVGLYQLDDTSFRVRNEFRFSDPEVVEMLTDGGLYIKEVLHGDEGRTEPSLSSLLKKEVQVESLDVMEVLYDPKGAPSKR